MRIFTFFATYSLPFMFALSAAEPAQTSTRPAPRKPFVSKSGGSSIKPLPSNQSVNAHTSGNISDPQMKSGQAEILTITRSHKPPTVHPVIEGQTSPIPPIEEGSAKFSTGSDAQVGRIIDRK